MRSPEKAGVAQAWKPNSICLLLAPDQAGEPGPSKLPLGSQWPILKVPEGSLSCHSRLCFPSVTKHRHAHNPKVGGSKSTPRNQSIHNGLGQVVADSHLQFLGLFIENGGRRAL